MYSLLRVSLYLFIYLSRLSGITEDQIDADVIKPSLAKGPNPALRKGPNDDLLL